jgi:hypothetical protein
VTAAMVRGMCLAYLPVKEGDAEYIWLHVGEETLVDNFVVWTSRLSFMTLNIFSIFLYLFVFFFSARIVAQLQSV